ncbi:hypothetical protein DFJ68_0931 [Terracoccus luteus]|uniref:Glycoside hydrolase family 127 protein n=1 Tax=Terracoccus luteus TaxID=53356 RepID=A0A495Y0M1_9MICO|nr:beta-L-arabinofuranosidase domain-containing protein [Terracoccus luteus]RKT77508.1 hypothetical protein DFJ68_0931 [Terracoccus luteus]
MTTVHPTACVGARGPLGRPLGPDAVRLHDGSGPEPARSGLLGRWQRRNREATAPHVTREIRGAGNLENFRRLVDGTAADSPYRGRYPFLDTDVYKTLEGLAYELARPAAPGEDPALVAGLRDFYEEAVDLVTRAQAPDGYLGTAFQGPDPLRVPWDDLAWGHELYNLGHLTQAAVAASRGLDDRRLLEVACRFADLAVGRYGDDGEALYCGHPEVEMALVELARETGDGRYLRLAQLFVDRRGSGALTHTVFPPEYFQDHVPLRELDSVTGHAVRMAYLGAGATDVAVETEDADLLDHLLRLWDDMVATKAYVTGGLGARHSDEAFGDRYELPSERAYAETCAAIGAMQWGWRLFVATGRADILDDVELMLYNAYAVGLSAEGTSFFYDNPLQRRPDHEQRSGAETGGEPLRRAWFGCPCCPPNVVRWAAELQDHVAVADERDLTIALLTAADVRSDPLDVTVETGYPYDGRVVVTVTRASGDARHLRLRVPGWATEGGRRLAVTVDGGALDARPDAGWLTLSGPWRSGTRVVLELPLQTRCVVSHPHVDATRGAVAVLRGPVVHCLEQQDAAAPVDDLVLVGVDPADRPDGEPTGAAGASPAAADDPWSPLAHAVTARVVARPPASGRLYPELTDPPAAPEGEPVVTRVRLVPYHLWGNREVGAMRVWLRRS